MLASILSTRKVQNIWLVKKNIFIWCVIHHYCFYIRIIVCTCSMLKGNIFFIPVNHIWCGDVRITHFRTTSWWPKAWSEIKSWTFIYCCNYFVSFILSPSLQGKMLKYLGIKVIINKSPNKIQSYSITSPFSTICIKTIKIVHSRWYHISLLERVPGMKILNIKTSAVMILWNEC